MVDVELRETGLGSAGPEVKSEVPDAGTTGPADQQQGGPDDLKDRIFEVRLETEKVRVEMANLSDRMNAEFGKVRVEMREMETRLIDRMDSEFGKVRVEIRMEVKELKKSAGRWLALGMSFLTVVVALVGVLS